MAIDYSKLSSIGRAKDVLDNIPNNPLQLLLQDQFNDLVDKLRQSIDKHDISTYGTLKNSIVPVTYKAQNGVLEIGIEAEFYWKFINYGVNGTKIHRGAPNWGKQPQGRQTFKQAIDSWIRGRGIRVRDSRMSYDSLNFLIRKSIVEKGKEPRPFVDDVINEQLLANMEAEITNFVGRAIEIRLNLT